MKNNATIFLIQENISFNSPLVKSLKRTTDSQILMYSNLEEIQEALNHSTPNLLVIDIDFSNQPARDSIIDLIGFAVPSIILSGKQEKKFAVSLLKKGAIDYVLKNENYMDVLYSAIAEAVSVIKLQLSLKMQKRKQMQNIQNIFTITTFTMVVISILLVVFKYF
ncbi:MAG: hypothetical protein AB8B74_15345 [Crocinitomicaceae bacterium]